MIEAFNMEFNDEFKELLEMGKCFKWYVHEVGTVLPTFSDEYTTYGLKCRLVHKQDGDYVDYLPDLLRRLQNAEYILEYDLEILAEKSPIVGTDEWVETDCEATLILLTTKKPFNA